MAGTLVLGAKSLAHPANSGILVSASCGGPSAAACATLTSADADVANRDESDLLELETPVSAMCPDPRYVAACAGLSSIRVQLFEMDSAGTVKYMNRNFGIGFLRDYMTTNGPFRPAGVAWATDRMALSYAGHAAGARMRLVLHATSGRWQIVRMSLNP